MLLAFADPTTPSHPLSQSLGHPPACYSPRDMLSEALEFLIWFISLGTYPFLTCIIILYINLCVSHQTANSPTAEDEILWFYHGTQDSALAVAGCEV